MHDFLDYEGLSYYARLNEYNFSKAIRFSVTLHKKNHKD